MASLVATHQAPECPVAIEARDETPGRLLRLRPSCGLGFCATRGAPVPPSRRLPDDAMVWVRLARR